MSLPGVKLDFNYGARVLIPEGNYHVRFTDLTSPNIIPLTIITLAVASEDHFATADSMFTKLQLHIDIPYHLLYYIKIS